MKLTDYEIETSHRQWYCKQDCSGCYICEGGLFHCRICGQAEAELEKWCPGKPKERE